MKSNLLERETGCILMQKEVLMEDIYEVKSTIAGEEVRARKYIVQHNLDTEKPIHALCNMFDASEKESQDEASGRKISC